MDFGKIFSEKVSAAHNSGFGKFLDAIALRLGGAEHAAFLNVLCTAGLGAVIVLPLLLVGKLLVFGPPLFYTLALLFIICGSIISYRYNKGRKIMQPLLAAAIVGSLPFGLLSLPLLHGLTSYKKKSA